MQTVAPLVQPMVHQLRQLTIGELMAQEKKEIVKATGVVGISTFLSRILGLIRDMVISGYFGASMVTDAFFIAFTVLR